MNVNQLINMAIRIVMRRLIGAGVNAGINAVTNKKGGGRRGGQRQMMDDGFSDQPEMDNRQNARRAKQMMRAGRKMGKF